jgi:VWFA-related protein
VPGSQPESIPGTTTSTRTDRRSDDSIGRMLDLAYSTADSYLETLAEKSGGRLLRADTLASLPDAFAKIAAELRTQYMLGYYPLNKERDEHYRKIKVATARKGVIIRSRPGYLATPAR